MVSTVKITSLLLIIVLIHLIQARFSDVPPPPKRPERFYSKEELKRYLQKVHEYHSIVGRWRLRRGLDELSSLHTSNDDDLFQFFDINHDHVITKSEFVQQLKSPNHNEDLSQHPIENPHKYSHI